MLDWSRFDTILLDMDGTVLDLAFDNYFWRELVPRCLARARGLDCTAAREEITALYAAKQGSLDWYCLDYWSAALRLDLRALKTASSHRIRFLPGARRFLHELGRSGRRVVLVSNAHGYTLAVKRGVAGLDRFFAACVSAHEFGMPKEQAEFWPALQDRLGFAADRTLFVDDSLPVLDAAAAFGLAGVVAVHRPDTRQPARAAGSHAGVDHLADLGPVPPAELQSP